MISYGCYAQDHPSLTMTIDGVKNIRNSLGTVDLFDKAVSEKMAIVDAEIELGILVPIPKDMAGGYTHERHKRNFFILQDAGNLYQITGDVKYAQYIKDYLIAYAKMYPTLPLHPTNKSYATGKIFWQCLNDANWLVYVSQAYDCIYDYLSKEDRDYLEKDLFKPFANFLSIENPQFFNRIHNHSTWANAAVGMIGIVMRDQELIDRSLYGLPIKEDNDLAKDNDGGFIYEKGMSKAGFLAQLDNSFAPDGYFTEGPYYLRYAIFPFLMFSKAIDSNIPDLDIMNYRDGILQKAVYTLINQTDANGEFFPINDAQKGMSWNARELVTAVNFMYDFNPQNTALLSLAEKQGKVLIDATGYKVAQAIKEGKATQFLQTSAIYGDGKNGDEGGVGIMRHGDNCLVVKFSAQGMGHGHFDKLSYSYYDNTGEVIQDYGAARWVNIDQKGGGRYLPENKTFAKQTIAHNTVVINEVSHYEANIEKGEAHHPDLFFSDISESDVQVISTKDSNAYQGSDLHRTIFMIKESESDNPIIVDFFKVNATNKQKYDLPTWFHGHLLSTSFGYTKELTNLSTIGNKYGYQHIWKEASSTQDQGNAKITWLHKDKFYTMTSSVELGDEIILGRGGANDPNYNLRPDPVIIHRKKEKSNILYLSVIESHGTYNAISEIPLNPFSSIQEVTILQDTKEYTIANVRTKNQDLVFAISNLNNEHTQSHQVEIGGKIIEWMGPFTLNKKTIKE